MMKYYIGQLVESLRRARAGGLRAGRSPRNFIIFSDGTKTIYYPENPYIKQSRILATIWEYYFTEGMRLSLIKKGN
jgi:hypothetical protein